jgi:hypothetical protein
MSFATASDATAPDSARHLLPLHQTVEDEDTAKKREVSRMLEEQYRMFPDHDSLEGP